MSIAPELRTAAIVPRWSIVWTLNKDYVSTHSFFVAMYSLDIATMLGTNDYEDTLLYMALTHDLDETITGDIVSPVKKAIVDKDKSDAYVKKLMQERLWGVVNNLERLQSKCSPLTLERFKAIVKIADQLDSLLFLVTEARMGNGVVSPLIEVIRKDLEKAWLNLYTVGFDSTKLKILWEHDITRVINTHKSFGGYGVL